MSDQNTGAQENLHKFGRHVRRNWAKEYPLSAKQMEKIHEAIRDEWERDQRIRRNLPSEQGPDLEP